MLCHADLQRAQYPRGYLQNLSQILRNSDFCGTVVSMILAQERIKSSLSIGVLVLAYTRLKKKTRVKNKKTEVIIFSVRQVR